MRIWLMRKISAICGLSLLLIMPTTQIALGEEPGMSIGAEASPEAAREFLDDQSSDAGIGPRQGPKTGAAGEKRALSTDVTLISPLPDEPKKAGDLGSYLQTLFTYGIGLAALLAMAQIIFGAVQYTASAGAPSLREDAKGRMTTAIIGLVLLILAATILATLGRQEGEGLSGLSEVAQRLGVKTRAINKTRSELLIVNNEIDSIENRIEGQDSEQATADRTNNAAAGIEETNNPVLDEAIKPVLNAINEMEADMLSAIKDPANPTPEELKALQAKFQKWFNGHLENGSLESFGMYEMTEDQIKAAVTVIDPNYKWQGYDAAEAAKDPYYDARHEVYLNQVRAHYLSQAAYLAAVSNVREAIGEDNFYSMPYWPGRDSIYDDLRTDRLRVNDLRKQATTLSNQITELQSAD